MLSFVFREPNQHAKRAKEDSSPSRHLSDRRDDALFILSSRIFIHYRTPDRGDFELSRYAVNQIRQVFEGQCAFFLRNQQGAHFIHLVMRKNWEITVDQHPRHSHRWNLFLGNESALLFEHLINVNKTDPKGGLNNKSTSFIQANYLMLLNLNRLQDVHTTSHSPTYSTQVNVLSSLGA